MLVVVVLDMDETLGVASAHDDLFHVRPHVDFLIRMLRCMGADIVLWSLGDDKYVQRVVNNYLPLVASYAYKIFARSEAKRAFRLYGYNKAGNHIRDMYDQDIFLVGVDDQVDRNMDTSYNLRIHAAPYKKPDKSDVTIWHICDKIVQSISGSDEIGYKQSGR